ncbi:MAG TPA: hypothetical protein VK820_02810 [Steroidobacteraceae bacterium]|jgi:hypothetical protein|nr:hypothetical protein [Steroidobacteraceae bacterium]
MSVAPIVEFSGRVDCRRDGRAPLGLILSGHTAHHPQELVRLSFAGAAPADLPQTLDDAAVARVSEASFCITSGARSWMISARAAHLHREVAREFYQALPAHPVRWTQRLFWRIVFVLAASSVGRWLLGARSRR